MGLALKETLKRLCCGNGWSYGVFWCFDQRNFMLLTMEDSYFEEEMGAVVNNMLLQVHMLGEGIIGQAALSGKNQWIFSDANKDMYQNDSEINCQLSSGLKTIAVVPVESRGVVQFGSTKKILETSEFLEQTKRLLSGVEDVNEIALGDNPPSSLSYDCDLNEWFTSFCNGNITPMHGGSCSELMDIAYTSMNFTQSSAFTSDLQQEKMDPLSLDSLQFTNQLQPACVDALAMLSSDSDAYFQQLSSHFAFSIEKSTANTPCISSLSNGGSILTSLESQLPSEMGFQYYPHGFSTEESIPVSSIGGLVHVEKTDQQNLGRAMNNLHSASLFHGDEDGLFGRETGVKKFQQEFKLDEFVRGQSNCYVADNLFEWFASTPENGISKISPTINEHVSMLAVSCGVVGDVSMDIGQIQPTNSVQSSITDTYACGNEQKSVYMNDAGNYLLKGFGIECGCEKATDYQENMKPVVSAGPLATSSSVSDCVSELDVNSANGPKKGLFSELGLEELLNGSNSSGCIANSSIDDQFSTAKRRRLESASLNQVKLGSISCSDGSSTTFYNDKETNPLSKKEVFPKSQVGLWIDDGYSINNGPAVLAKSKKNEEPTKAVRKRARPGESTRPRPKDRQQIQDRMRELKGIIPDGGKCSIDALLDRTIKYMLFLQSVTKYADKIKQADEPKLIGEVNRKVLKENTTGSGGATWALEVGEQSMVCPIIVEDLSPPGLMLIEMLCEDRGFFLEIADVIRGFGLNVLKGVMETREDKIWARFIVEANTHITRIDIFWSLVQLLQLTSATGVDSTNQPGNVLNDRIPPTNNYQQPVLPCPITITDTLQ